MAPNTQILHDCVAQKLIELHSDATYIFPENEVRLQTNNLLVQHTITCIKHVARGAEVDSYTF